MLYNLNKVMSAKNGNKNVLIVLNNVLTDVGLLDLLWGINGCKIFADGGSNRMFDLDKEKYIPDYIIGDLDSISDTAYKHYLSKKVEIKKIPDQDNTDLGKCLDFIQSKYGGNFDNIFILGAFGGRFDHVMGNLNFSFKYQEYEKLILLGDGNYGIILREGENEILPNFDIETKQCSIVPMFGKAVLTTEGLKWNMNNAPSEFGGLVSTSNIIAEEKVLIHSTKPVLYTSEIITLSS
jgi:thiamine pyrophosphokinase